MKKMIDNKIVDMTAEEIAEKNADIEKAKAETEKIKTDFNNRETKKASGKQKLKDLGLDDDEIKALTGA
tara:strand:- start:43 stop:249 length:207 start_codon:yes stop_codon:yes gene_type:complete